MIFFASVKKNDAKLDVATGDDYVSVHDRMAKCGVEEIKTKKYLHN